jgi:hypothetical protein
MVPRAPTEKAAGPQPATFARSAPSAPRSSSRRFNSIDRFSARDEISGPDWSHRCPDASTRPSDPIGWIGFP